MKLKNEVNEMGKFLCGGPNEQRIMTGKGCGTETIVGQLLNGILFCFKCVDIIKGRRTPNGMLIKGR